MPGFDLEMEGECISIEREDNEWRCLLRALAEMREVTVDLLIEMTVSMVPPVSGHALRETRGLFKSICLLGVI